MMRNNKGFTVIEVFVVSMILMIIIFGPFLAIWCLNSIGTKIPYSFRTWFSLFCLGFLFGGGSTVSALGSCFKK